MQGWLAIKVFRCSREEASPSPGRAASVLPAAGVPAQAPLGASEGLRLWNLQKVLSFWGYSKRVCVLAGGAERSS